MWGAGGPKTKVTLSLHSTAKINPQMDHRHESLRVMPKKRGKSTSSDRIYDTGNWVPLEEEAA